MKEQTKNQVLVISKVSNDRLINPIKPSQKNMTSINVLSDVVRLTAQVKPELAQPQTEESVGRYGK